MHPHIATTHVYHTADPIPQGVCTGFGSPCSQAGFALETRCHLGESIVFDTVKKLGWSVDVRKHIIKEVVMNVLESDAWWGEDDEDSGVDEAGFRSPFGWNKRGKKGKKGEDEEDEEEKKKRREGKRNVPKAIIEDDCIVSLCWKGGDDITHSYFCRCAGLLQVGVWGLQGRVELESTNLKP